MYEKFESAESISKTPGKKMWIKLAVIVLFIAVVISLSVGFYFLLTEKTNSTKLLNSLKIRISLTVLIMVIIVCAWLHGDIHSQTPWLFR